MQIKLVAITLTLVFTGPLHAGGVADLIFKSGFEAMEACETFDGLNDTVLVPTVHISGAFTLDGQAFPVSEYDDAVFSLRDRITGDVIELGNSHDLNYSANIIPARYDVMYSVETRGDNVPRNIAAVLMHDVALLADQTLDIDVTSFRISGDFLHNGAPFPASEYDDGLIFLNGDVTGRLMLGDSKLQSFTDVVVLPGEYEVRFQAQTPDTVPWNEWGLVGMLNIASDNNALDINVQSVALSGRFTHNGLPMPASEYDDGNFYLETATGDRVFLENSHSGGYDKHVITGNYDIYWELETAGDTVPFNERARIGSNVSVASGLLSIDMDSYPVAGNFTLNGGLFPASVQNTGQIIFRDQISGTENVLALTMDGSYDQRVVRGIYDIVYQHLQGQQVPQNKNAVLSEGVIIKNAASIDIDVPSRLFTAPVLHNGVLFPVSQQQVANMLVRNPASGDLAFLGKTSLQNLSTLLVPGTYDVYYSHLNGDEIPQNSMARILEGLVVEPPGPAIQGGGGIQLNVNSVLITGQMLLNDGPMPASEYDDGLLNLRREEDSVLLGNTHDQSYQVRVVNEDDWADFQVHYGVETRGESIPWNGDAQVMCIQLDPIIL